MERHIFIINPQAGKHRGIDLIGDIKKEYNHYEIIITKYPGHAKEIVANKAKKGVRFYAVGGDGTLNEVVNGVIASGLSDQVAIAPIPCGSGNDFIRSVTDEINPHKLLKAYKVGEIKTIDVGWVNGRYFINIASAGFDALIVHNARRYKRIPLVNEKLSYLISVIITIINLKDYLFRIQINKGSVIEKRVIFTTFSNGKYYGGGMIPTPFAKLDSGVLDFCIIDKITRRKILTLLPKFIKGKHLYLDEVNILQGEALKLISNKTMPINIDGEIIWGKKVSVKLIKKGINILLP